MRFLIPFLLAAVILSGCSSMMQNSDKDKGEAIIKFINEDVQEANDYQEASANILNSLILSNQEEATIHDKLKSEAIPKAEKAVDIVKDIDIPISELEEPHTLLETAITDFAGALELVAEVMVSNDAAVEKKADEKFQSYEQSLEKYHSSIAEVAKEFGIEYEKSGLENSTSLPTDVNESNSGTSPGQQAVITFINEDVSSFSSKQSKAFQALENVVGDNYTDDQTVYNTLIEKVIPMSKEVVTAVKEIEPEIEELEAAKMMLVDATELTVESFQLRAKAIKNQDEELMKKSDEKYTEYYEIMQNYHSEMSQIATNNDVKYEPEPF